MAARRAPIQQVVRSLRTSNAANGSSSSRLVLAPATIASSSSAWSSQTRTFASAASTTASSSSTSAASPSPSPISARGGDFRSSPALGTNVTAENVLSHLSSASSSSDLLGSNAELALRAVTHESYFNAREGHNRRLAFVGRRSLKLFTTLFLHSRLQTVSKGDAAHNYINRLLESPTAVDSILVTHRLGDKVGRDLGLEKVMRWTPAISDGQLGPKETGLFKVRGVTVEALVGAIYHQKGAMEASKFFHNSILPSLLQDGFPGPVPEELKQAIASPAAQA